MKKHIHFAMKSLLALNIVILTTIAWAKNQDRKLEYSEESPRGDIVVRHYKNFKADDQHFREIWLVSKKNSKKRYLLYSYSRNADVIFSPDQSWLVINDYLASNSSQVRLFKKKKGVRYSAVKGADIFNQAWRIFSKENDFQITDDFNYRYAEVLKWASDSKSFLISIEGHSSGDANNEVITIDPWFCVFDLNTMKTSLDFRLMNRNVLHRNK